MLLMLVVFWPTKVTHQQRQVEEPHMALAHSLQQIAELMMVMVLLQQQLMRRLWLLLLPLL